MKVEDKGKITYRNRSKYSVIMAGLERKEEVKKEFQEYLNNSCDRYKEDKK